MNFSIPEEYQESYPNNPKEVGESIFKLYIQSKKFNM